MTNKAGKFVLFFIGGEMWAMPLMSGNRFDSCDNMVPIPDSDKDIVGLMYNNGHIVTVLNTASILSISPHHKKLQTCLLFDYAKDHYAILVDEGGETVSVKKVLTDRSKNRKTFKKYIKFKNNKIYILSPEDIWERVGIYD